MRIAVLSRNFSVRGGGAERYAVSVAEQMAKQHEVHVFAQNFENVLPGVTYHRVPCPCARPRWINQLYFAWATWRMTRKGFDVVHSHENTWHGDIQTVHVLPIKHTLFTGRHGWGLALRWLKVLTSPRLLTYLWLEAARYKNRPGRKVVLTSHTLRSVMEQAYPHAAHMFTVIPPGVATVEGKASPELQRAARERLGLPLNAQLLLFVGNDFVKKGLPTLLQAVARMPAEVHLAVVGQSAQMDAMRRLAAPVQDRVHFLGSLPDVSAAYRAADVLVHPTLEDTYAMVVLEAMAHGLPVVVSGAEYCGIAVELSDGSNAQVLENPQSSAEIDQVVQRIMGDADLAENMSNEATVFAQTRTWNSLQSTYDGVVVEVKNAKVK